MHDFEPWQIDNNIGSYVANELLPLLAESRGPMADGYAYSKQEIFERYVGGIVRSRTATNVAPGTCSTTIRWRRCRKRLTTGKRR